MKKITFVAMLALLLVPAIAFAQPAGCSWEGDPAMFYTFGMYEYTYLGGAAYEYPGPDHAEIFEGYSLLYVMGPYNASSTWGPATCWGTDTFCFHVVSKKGLTLTCNPPQGVPTELEQSTLIWTDLTITYTCGTGLPVGTVDTIIASMLYTNVLGVCDPTCGDCANPNTRPSDGRYYWTSDTLIVTVVESPPLLAVLQDTLTLVEQGQTQAYVPFGLCTGDYCTPLTRIDYLITSTGHLPATINNGYVELLPGACKTVYAIVDGGAAAICTYDTMQIVAWTGSPAIYDTCVQVLHVVEAQDVPLFTVPVVTILVLALILAAAVFMRRRAAARA